MRNNPILLFVNTRKIEKEQFTCIMAAKNLGYDIVLLTNSKPNRHFQHFFQHIEIVDTFISDQALAAVDKLAKIYRIVGVPAWTEADVELVAHICAKLDLPGLPVSAAKKARNKFIMKSALADYPELLPMFKHVNDIASLTDAINEIGFPAIIKPIGAFGSKGIFKLHTPQDAYSAFAQLQKIAKPNFDPIFKQYGAEFIIEEYLDGDEFSVEGFVTNNQVHIVGITDKWTTQNYYQEYQHIFPSNKPVDIQKEIFIKSDFIIKKLGLNNCGFHLEAKITSKGFRFIEVAARLGGDYINSHLIPFSTGINMFENLIRIAAGQQPILNKHYNIVSGIRYIVAQQAGQFIQISGLDNVLQNPYIENFILVAPLNSLIKMPPEHFNNPRLAACIIKHPDYQFCEKILKEIDHACIPYIKAS